MQDLQSRLRELDDELRLSQRADPLPCRDGVALIELWAAAGLAGLGGVSASAALDGADDASPYAGAPTGPSLSFEADLEVEGQRRGLELAAPAGHGVLLVVDVERSCGAEAWNSRCSREQAPRRRLQLGAAILAVNGIVGNVRRMQQELQSLPAATVVACNPPTLRDAVAVLRAVHCAAPLPAPPFWSEAAGQLALRHPVSAEVPRSGPAAEGDLDVTVVITTSPVPSNPSTEMLETVLGSLDLVPGLARARKIVVCDGFSCVQGGQKPRHKQGKITAEDAARYHEFVDGLQAAAAAAQELGCGVFSHAEVLRLPDHHGFGHAVRRALQEVSTDFVMVVQHDHEFIRAFDLRRVLEVMKTHAERVKYVGLPSVTTLRYDQQVLSKYRFHLAATHEFGFPLMPLIFFYDKPHVCCARYYREAVFGEGSLVKQGEFVEETFGKAERADILANGMSAHRKYGTFQLDDRDAGGEMQCVVRHMNGRSFMTPSQRVANGWPAALKFKA